jgi:cytochrome o ubiquinol oxidase subunit 1
MKKHPHKKPLYTDIWVPKNSGVGAIIGFFALGFGVAVVWHIWWMLVLCLVVVVVTLIVKLTGDDTDRKITAREVEEEEEKLERQAFKERVA